MKYWLYLGAFMQISKHLESRRMVLGTLAVICLTFLGYTKGADVSLAIAGVVGAVAGANSFEATKRKREVSDVG